jgi:hypothetical protein
MLDLPWKVKGICLGAPKPGELALFEEFVEKKLAPGGCNLIVMLVRYRYQFKSHPECTSPDSPIGEGDVKRMLEICRRFNIRLVPKMNLLGHQSGKTRDSMDGLLRGHPEFDETPEKDEVFYCRSLCPSHPGVKPVVYALMDELVDVFESDGVHIAIDEVFDLGKCDRCKDTPTYKLLADWVNGLAGHNRARNVRTMMWGDRLLNGLETGYGFWEASGNFTEPAIDLLDKDILICDWHYENRENFPSVEVFAEAGFRMMVCPWRYREHAEKFVGYAKEHDKGHIEGLLATTWMDAGKLMRYMLYGDAGGAEGWEKETLNCLPKTLEWIFS